MRSLGAFLLLVSAVLARPSAASGQPAQERNPTPFIATKAMEAQVAFDEGYLAWVKILPNETWQLYLRSPDGKVVHVNRPGTEGILGSIAGGRLVFQEYTRNSSTIRFMDIRTGRTWDAPPVVNKRGTWEFWPVMTERWLVVSRFDPRAGVPRVHRIDLKNNRSAVLWNAAWDGSTYIQPGQANGRYFVMVEWNRGYPSELIVADLKTRQLTRVRRDRRDLWAPSIREDGTVYAVTTGKRCGSGPRLVRYGRDTTSSFLNYRKPTALAPLGEGFDSFYSHAYTDGLGAGVLYQRARCTNRQSTSDIWSYRDMVPLTVVNQGLGFGTVTSSPAGISCDTDGECVARFPGGTTVRLKAEPGLASTFEGWSGNCARQSVDVCEVELDQAARVGATFEPGI